MTLKTDKPPAELELEFCIAQLHHFCASPKGIGNSPGVDRVIERLEALPSHIEALRAGLRKALKHIPYERSHEEILVDYDPAGSTYEFKPHPWYVELCELAGEEPLP